MTLEQLRALLREKHAGLQALREKAVAETSSAEDLQAYKDALKECEGILDKIEALELDEQLKAKASLPASTPIPGIGHNSGASAQVAQRQLSLEQELTFTAAAIVVSRSTGEHPFKVLEDAGCKQLADKLGTHPANRTKAVNTLVSAEGGILVPQAQVGGIVPLLRGVNTFLDAAPTRVELVNGQYKTGRGATGATAGYVGEGGRKPVSTPTFDAIDMRAKKIAGIVLLTQEARKWTIGGIEEYVRNDLRSAIASALDLNAWLGTGAGSSPLGIFNKAGVQTFTGTFGTATAPTLEELDAFAGAMVLRLVTNNIFANNGRFRWVMSYRTAMFLASVRTTGGDLAFPTMQGAGVNEVSWKGFPVSIVHQIPTTGGGTTDEALLALVDMSHVLYGEEEGINMKFSDQATIDPDGTGANNVHLFQDNMAAILAEAEHDFGLRFSKAVVKSTVRF